MPDQHDGVARIIQSVHNEKNLTHLCFVNLWLNLQTFFRKLQFLLKNFGRFTRAASRAAQNQIRRNLKRGKTPRRICDLMTTLMVEWMIHIQHTLLFMAKGPVPNYDECFHRSLI